MRETQVWSLGWEDPLEKEMATHSSILAWRIPWREEPGGLQFTGLQRVRHDWATALSLCGKHPTFRDSSSSVFCGEAHLHFRSKEQGRGLREKWAHLNSQKWRPSSHRLLLPSCGVLPRGWAGSKDEAEGRKRCEKQDSCKKKILRNGILPATSVNKGYYSYQDCIHHQWAGEPGGELRKERIPAI